MKITEEELNTVRGAAHEAYAQADALLMKWKQEDAPKEPTPEEKNRAVIREYEERKAKGEKVELWFRNEQTGKDYLETVVPTGAIEHLTYFIREPKEPTLEERNALLQKRWDAMNRTLDSSVREENGKNYVVELLERGGEWIRVIPQWVPTVEYRIIELPEPKFIPFTRENCPVGAIIKSPGGNRHIITSACASSLFLMSDSWVTYGALLDDYTMDDGSPCGTEVSE